VRCRPGSCPAGVDLAWVGSCRGEEPELGRPRGRKGYAEGGSYRVRDPGRGDAESGVARRGPRGRLRVRRLAVICSAWGPDIDWIRNIRVRPALRVQIGRESFTPDQRFLSEDESLAVVAGFGRLHPWTLRLVTSVLGWGDLRSDAAAREFVSVRPFVSLRPADPSRA